MAKRIRVRPVSIRLCGFLSAAILLIVLATPSGLRAQSVSPDSLPVIHVPHGANSAAAMRAHYVALVSLDRFRWDYAVRDHAENLLQLGRDGAWAPSGMLPTSMPTLDGKLNILSGTLIDNGNSSFARESGN